MNLRSAPLLVGLLSGAWLWSTQAVAQSDDLAPHVEATIAWVRQVWPDAGQAAVTDGQVVEFHDGKVQIGLTGLKSLLPTETAEQKAVVRDFIIAHELWHSIQSKRESAEVIEKLRTSRILECEADFMAAHVLANRSSANPAGAQRLSALTEYLEKKPLTTSNASYPPPASRAKTAALGWHVATNPALFASSERWKGLQTSAIARDLCRFITQENDGSLGAISLALFRGTDTEGDTRQVEVRYRNFSQRPVSLSYAVVGTWWSVADDAKSIIGVFPNTLRLKEKEAGSQTVKIPLPKTPDSGLFDVWTMFTGTGIRDEALATSSFDQEQEAKIDYCYARLLKAAEPQDKALFARLATIVLAATDHFKSIRSESYEESGVGTRRYDFAGKIGTAIGDGINLTGAGSSASLTVRESDDEGAMMKEYQRLAGFIRTTCPKEIEEDRDREGDPRMMISIIGPSANAILGFNKTSERSDSEGITHGWVNLSVYSLTLPN